MILQNTVVVAGFVLTIMLLVEFGNILLNSRRLSLNLGTRQTQYLLCIALGLIPGCFGVFAVVTFFMHRLVTLGGLVAAAIATAGDEAFVMLAMNPVLSLVLSILCAAIAFVTAVCVDRVVVPDSTYCEHMVLHDQDQPQGDEGYWSNWREGLPLRLVLASVHLLFFLGIITGKLGHSHDSLFLNLALSVVGLLAIAVFFLAPYHFVTEHYLNHICKKHAPRLIGWTFLAYILIFWLFQHEWLLDMVRQNPVWLLVVACTVGLLPESGPHILFFTLYQAQQIPFAVLLASTIVQDGHGLLPLLSHSFKQFITVKLINVVAGLLAGVILLAADFLLSSLVTVWIGG